MADNEDKKECQTVSIRRGLGPFKDAPPAPKIFAPQSCERERGGAVSTSHVRFGAAAGADDAEVHVRNYF